MLRITEIFHSLQGETTSMGRRASFIRLTGCPMRCSYCDTNYAFHGGEKMSTAAILTEIAPHHTKLVVVTGGEPLAQSAVHPLLRRLCDQNYHVFLETGGGLPIEEVDARVTIVLDIKTPHSGEAAANRWENLEHLKAQDQIKIVLCSRDDYQWSQKLIAEHNLADRCEILYSPAHGLLDPRELAEWMLADHAPARLQIQLHKLLWGEHAKGK